MNWLLWSTVGSAIYFLAKKPDSAVLVPKSDGAPLPVVAAPSPKPPSQPAVVVKTVITNGRKYLVTRAGLGIYKVQLASDPTVFQLITQTGPLQERGDPAKLAQLKADEAQFPGNLFS